MKGTVYKSTGSWYTVKGRDGSFYECRIKGKFRMEGIKSTNPIAVGDGVSFELEVFFSTKKLLKKMTILRKLRVLEIM